MVDRVVMFEPTPEDMPFFFDEKAIPNAVAAEIETGPHKGIYLFSNRQRAEEFCWKRLLEPVFEQSASKEKQG